MHDWVAVASEAWGANFRGAEQDRGCVQIRKAEARRRNVTGSKDCQMRHGRSDHDGAASNESLNFENTV